MNAYDNKVAEDARLFILKELAAQTDGRLNVLLLQRILETRYGVARIREWVESQLRYLEQLAAVELTVGEVIIAQIARTGRDHLAMRVALPGVTAPAELSD